MYYLCEFNDEIKKVVKTHGLNLNNDGAFRIDYVNEPTEEQVIAVNNLIQSYPLFCKKLEKGSKIDAEWKQTIAQGWDSGQGRLGLTAEDVALLSGAFTLAKEAAALGLPLPKLITLDDQTIPFATIQEMTTLLLRYGAARAELSETFASRRKAVESATTLEELNALP